MKKIKIRYILSFVWALFRHILDRYKKTPKMEYNMRIHTCLSCLHLDSTPRPWEHCNECGCPVREKASWRSERCPKNKWIAWKN